jgi:hypothetical protein
MKKIVFTFFLVVLTNLLFAQDIITFKNGHEIKVKILQITLSEISYKPYDNQTDPTIILKLADIKSFKYDERSFKERSRIDSIENISLDQKIDSTDNAENQNTKVALKKNKKLTFGFSMGMDIANWWHSGLFIEHFHNEMAGSGYYLNIHPDPYVGFRVGFSVNYRFKPWLEMQTELNWLGMGQSSWGDSKLTSVSGARIYVNLRTTWAVNYLQIPLMIRFINKKNLFLAIGPHLSIFTDARIKLKVNHSSGNQNEEASLEGIRPLNTGITLGAGIQTKWIGIEFRYLCDFLDVFGKDYNDYGIKNQVFQLNVSINFGR